MSTESQQFIDRLTVAPDSARQTLYEALIDGLVSDGVWTKLDLLYVMTAQESLAARTNLISTNFELEKVGAVAFNLDHTGYTGPADTAKFLNTGYNLSSGGGLYARDSASGGAFLTAGPSAGVDSGCVLGNPTGDYSNVYPHFSDNRFYWCGNGAFQTGATGSSVGLFSWTRSGANTNVGYRNGVQDTAKADASQALAAQTLRVFLGSATSAAASVKLAAVFSGGALLAADHLALYNRLNTYITAVNAAVGSADPVTLGATASTVIDDTTFSCTPGLTRMANRNLIAVYCAATDENITDGVWKKKTSTDNGATWSAASTLYTPSAGFAACDVEIQKLADDTLVVSGLLFNAGTPALTYAGVLVGNADGSSWSSIIVATTSVFTGAIHTTSKVIQLANGTLVLPVYGRVSGDSTDSVGVTFSTDGGASWGNSVIAVRGVTGEQYNEVGGALLQSRIVLIVRHDISAGTTGYVRAYSDDSGATWSAPVSVRGGITTPGRPAVLKLGENELFMWARFGSLVHSRWGISLDGGIHWSPFTPFGTSATEEYFYASSVLSEDGLEIFSILSSKRTVDDAYIVFQSFNNAVQATEETPTEVWSWNTGTSIRRSRFGG